MTYTLVAVLMRSPKLFLTFLLFSSVCKNTTFPFKELLSLNTLTKRYISECSKSYLVQRMIVLLLEYDSGSRQDIILRNTILGSVMEKPESGLRQGVVFEQMLDLKSEGLIIKSVTRMNSRLNPPDELLSLFTESGSKGVREFLNGPDDLDLNLTSQTNGHETWLMVAIIEAITAWKQLKNHIKFILSTEDFMNTLNEISEPGFDPEERMKFYLDFYELLVKPKLLHFDFGGSHALYMTMFYFFQYLHQLSRVYALDLSSGLMDSLQRAHETFLLGSDQFATDLTTSQRTLQRTIPFLGWWCHNDLLEDGISVYKDFYTIDLTKKFMHCTALVKVSVYYEEFERREDVKSAGTIRLQKMGKQILELIIYTSKKFREEWLNEFEERLKKQKMSSQLLKKMFKN